MEPFRRTRRAFTLIELLVVLGIIAVLATIVFTSQSNFNKTLIVANTAYDIALSIRSAETFGLSSRAGDTSVNTGYGIDFKNTSPKIFTLFADSWPAPSSSSVTNCHSQADPNTPDAKPGNCVYDPTHGEKKTEYTLGNGITISYFCAYNTGPTGLCSTTGHAPLVTGLTFLDISFVRPNSTTFIYSGTIWPTSTSYSKACLGITSPQGGWRYVTVTQSGEISANAASCP